MSAFRFSLGPHDKQWKFIWGITYKAVHRWNNHSQRNLIKTVWHIILYFCMSLTLTLSHWTARNGLCPAPGSLLGGGGDGRLPVTPIVCFYFRLVPSLTPALSKHWQKHVTRPPHCWNLAFWTRNWSCGTEAGRPWSNTLTVDRCIVKSRYFTIFRECSRLQSSW